MKLVKVLERLLSAIPVALGVALLAFFSMRLLPGDPVEIMLGDTQASQAELDALRRELGLDQPLHLQLWDFFTGLLRGDLGTSIVQRQDVVEILATTLPATIELTLATLVVAVLIAVPVGILSAVRQGSWLDRLVLSGALLGVSMPAFWFGLLLILLFAVELRWLPTSGQMDPAIDLHRITGFLLLDSLLAWNWQAFSSALKHLLLPAFTLGIVFSAVLARVIRSSMVEVLRMEYLTAARAKGVPEWQVILKHAFRNALIPAVTVTGLHLGELLGGNMIVETIFSWPGLGRLVVSSIFAKDYVMVQAAVMLYAITYVLANLLVDILYTVLNPKVEL
jgi:peptide/nickel transport system permease protein